MTKIKLCGLTRACDIAAVNELLVEYIGFVFAKKSRRYVSMEQAFALKERLSANISCVGVFVNEEISNILSLQKYAIIDMIQLHGTENEAYIHKLRLKTDAPIIQAFRIDTEADVQRAIQSSADYILLDSGNGGTGTAFDWSLIQNIHRPYFLAGGLQVETVSKAIDTFRPYAVDVSSGIETDGVKDFSKMKQFVQTVRACTSKEEHNE